MKVKAPSKLIYDEGYSTQDKFEKISSVANYNFEDTWKVLSNLDFENNFKAVYKEIEFKHNSDIVVYHKLQDKINGWFISKGSKIERLLLVTGDRVKITLKPYLKSTVTRTGATSATVTVVNPYLFDKDDEVIINSAVYTVKSVNLSSREILINTSITYASGAEVVLNKATETLLIY